MNPADHIAALEARNARLEEQVREAYERCAIAIEKTPMRFHGKTEDVVRRDLAQILRTLTTKQTND